MSETETTNGSTAVREFLSRLGKKVSRSVSLMTIVLGLLLIATSPLLTLLSDVMAVVFVIWGVAAAAFGAVAYVVLWLNKTFRD